MPLFQSHAGSIEASEARLRRWEMKEFQSHAGSIEARTPQGVQVFVIKFQSHAGSIEAPRAPRVPRPGGGLFQSHAGSIEALRSGISPPHSWLRFNPTLVRLRRKTAMINELGERCFNPTLVRLRQ